MSDFVEQYSRLPLAQEEYRAAQRELSLRVARLNRIREQLDRMTDQLESAELEIELAERRLAQAESWLGRIAWPGLSQTDAYRAVLSAEGKLQRGEPL